MRLELSGSRRACVSDCWLGAVSQDARIQLIERVWQISWSLEHCEKSLFVLAFHQKIPFPRIENPAADTRKFFPPPIDLIYIPHGRKFFWSLEGVLLHSQMPEKFSGPWNETFYIPPCHKSLASGGRPCLAPGTRISRHWGMQKASFQGPEESGRLFRHGDGKKP